MAASDSYLTTAKARLDKQVGDPDVGYISKADVQTAMDDLQDGWQADISAGTTPSAYGEHIVAWNGSAWRYRGATVTARPTTAAYGDGAYVVWDTSQHSAVTSPPSLGIAGDKWHPHPDAAI